MRTSIRIRQQQSLNYLHSLPSKQPKASISKAEAEVLLHRISNANCSIFANVVLIVKNNAHLALGFRTVQDCLRKRCDISNSYISRLIAAVAVYMKLDHQLVYLSKVSESTFRPLVGLSDSHASLAWYIATENNQNKRIRSSDILKALQKTEIKQDIKPKTVSIRLTPELKQSVDRYVMRISDALIENVDSEEQVKQLAKEVYKQLIETCRSKLQVA